MRKVKLGATDLEVSRICFGTWQFGGDWGAIDERDAIAAVARARELGIDFFDTAQAYGFGVSERLLARALEGVPREQVVLATKGGLRKEGGELLRDSSPQWLRSGLEASLRNLNTDYVDVYQVHWPDPATPFAETAATLEQFVQEGRVRYVGTSNYDAHQIAEFERTRRMDTLQPPYHMLRRDVEQAVLPYCEEHEIGVLAYGPLAHGLLSGHFDAGTQLAEDDWRRGSDLFGGANYDRNLRIVGQLSELARELGITVAQLAIAWVLAHPAVHVAIVGARRPDHVEGAAPAAAIDLDAGTRGRIEEILREAATVGGPTPEGVSERT